MTRPRVPETDSGIQGEEIVGLYNRFQRHMRDKGLLHTDDIIKAEIAGGLVLEIGPGPGYLGLEWLTKTSAARLKALEISPDMVALAMQNAREYGLESRVEYITGTGLSMPFENLSFDGVFTSSSLHEWHSPQDVLSEIHRVLKPGGRFFISDLRRDIRLPVKWFMRKIAKPKEILPGMEASINASYIPEEIPSLFAGTPFTDYQVRPNPFGLIITGKK